MKMRRQRRARAARVIQARRMQTILDSILRRREEHINARLTRAMVHAFSLLGFDLPDVGAEFQSRCREIFDQVPEGVSQSEVRT